MSKISKFLQITPRLLLEYTYDTNVTDSAQYNNIATPSLVRTLDGKLMFFDNSADYSDALRNKYKNNFFYTAFPDANGDTFFYPGYMETNIRVPKIVERLINRGILKQEVVKPSNLTAVPYEEIKIHILTGYTFSDNLGFMLTVKARQNSYKSAITGRSVDEDVVLGRFVYHKGHIANTITLNPQPLFMAERFYDRYISFYVPSAYYLTNRNSSNEFISALNIANGTSVYFEYNTITDEAFRTLNGTNAYYNFVTPVTATGNLFNQGTFYLRNTVDAVVPMNSNSDYFNIKIYYDDETNCVKYYPVWGNVTDDTPVSVSIMNAIESGMIPFDVAGFNDNVDAEFERFTEIYGDDARKWIIQNSLDIVYRYVNPLNENDVMERVDHFSSTEDFTDDLSSDNGLSGDENYRFLFHPVVRTYAGKVCRYINITYTARLMNRLNGAAVVRMGAVTIDKAQSRFGTESKILNVSNIYTWKLFNKNVTVQPVVNDSGSAKTVTKYITKYVQSNIIVTKGEDGVAYSAGSDYVLWLYETDHNYKFNFFKDSEMSEVLDLTGSNTYKLRFKDKDGNNITLNTVYSSNTPINGELEFRITESNVQKILKGDGKFAIIAVTPENGVSTLFAGLAKSVYDRNA